MHFSIGFDVVIDEPRSLILVECENLLNRKIARTKDEHSWLIRSRMSQFYNIRGVSFCSIQTISCDDKIYALISD